MVSNQLITQTASNRYIYLPITNKAKTAIDHFASSRRITACDV